MKKHIKRHSISFVETFVGGFLGTLVLTLDNIIETGIVTEDILIALLVGASVAGCKAVLKILRENYFTI